MFDTLGIVVSNTPGAVDDATATNGLYLMISALRTFSLGERTLRAGKWKAGVEAGKSRDRDIHEWRIVRLWG